MNISKTHFKEYPEVHDYTRQAHVLRGASNTFRERTCKYVSKRKSYESSQRRFNNLLLQLEDLSQKCNRSNWKTRFIQRSQLYDKFGRSCVCCDV